MCCPRMCYFAATLLVLCNLLHDTTSQEYYPVNEYNVDVDGVLKSDRLLKNYVDCLLDKGTCTPAGKELKREIPEALETKCVKCTDVHKTTAKKVIKYLMKNKPEYWKQLVEKFDSTGKYREKYAEFIKKAELDQ